MIKSKKAAGKYALAVAIAVLIVGLLILIIFFTNNPAAKQTAIEIAGAVTGKPAP